MEEYISIDIETTGLNRNEDQVLEIGAIIERPHNPLPFEELPKFHAIIKHDRYSGSAYAINMNQRIFKILAEEPRGMDEQIAYQNKYNLVHADLVAQDFYFWCIDNLTHKPFTTGDPITTVVAGKNFTDFDKPFLKRLLNWDRYFNLHRRPLDPATSFTDFTIDVTPPSLSVCLERAGIEDTVVDHYAINDAWQVIQVLRTKYGVHF